MRANYWIVLIFAIGSFLSCDDDSKYFHDFEIDGYVFTNEIDDINELTEQTYYQVNFDDQGRISDFIQYIAGEEVFIYQVAYTKEGLRDKISQYRAGEPENILKREDYFKVIDGKNQLSNVKIYDNQGVLVSEKIYQTPPAYLAIDYIYDDYGKLFQKHIMTYDKDGLLEKEEFMEDDNEARAIYYKYRNRMRYTSTEYQFGKIYNEIYYYTNAENTPKAKVIEYDAQGRKTKLSEYYTNGNLKEVRTYDYENGTETLQLYNKTGGLTETFKSKIQ